LLFSLPDQLALAAAQLLHGGFSAQAVPWHPYVFADGLDVEPLCGSNVRVTQDCLDHGVWDPMSLGVKKPEA
jgi:hypothetical protein